MMSECILRVTLMSGFIQNPWKVEKDFNSGVERRCKQGPMSTYLVLNLTTSTSWNRDRWQAHTVDDLRVLAHRVALGYQQSTRLATTTLAQFQVKAVVVP